jgi:hypothetical protein
MSIMTSIKNLTPKTPKQWALFVAGSAGVLLAGQYFYVDNKDDALIMKLWHKLHGGGGAGKALPAAGKHARAHAQRGLPAAHQQAAATVPAPMSMPPAYPYPAGYGVISDYAPGAAIVEEVDYGYGGGVGWDWRHHYGHDLGHVPHEMHQGMHPAGIAAHAAHAAQRPPMPQHIPTSPGAPPHPATHHTGYAEVPPPGSRGIVSTTPPAPTDPQVSGAFAGAGGDQPCGPGLWFNQATGACVPYPTTGPVSAGWE